MQIFKLHTWDMLYQQKGYPLTQSKLSPGQCPNQLKTFNGFWGLLTTYYCWFIKNFATITKPLHWLTKKGVPFSWTLECKNSFNLLKTQHTSAPHISAATLTFPDWSRPFILNTDPSNTDIGVVLSQQQEDRSECAVV